MPGAFARSLGGRRNWMTSIPSWAKPWHGKTDLPAHAPVPCRSAASADDIALQGSASRSFGLKIGARTGKGVGALAGPALCYHRRTMSEHNALNVCDNLANIAHRTAWR